MQIDVRRGRNGINQQLAQLQSTLTDWASWDETYEFVQDLNEDYIHNNLQDDTTANLNLSFILYLDLDGRVRHAKWMNLYEVQEEPFPPDFQELLSSSQWVITATASKEGRQGIFSFRNLPMMTAAQPILKNDRSGPAMGIMVVGRLMDDPFMAQLSDRLHLKLQITPFEGGKTHLKGHTSLLGGPEILVARHDQQIDGFGVMEDFKGEPSFVLRITNPRDVYRHGIVTFYYTIGATLLLVVIFSLLFFLIIERSVLNPLSRLSKRVRHIGWEGNIIEENIELNRRDELGVLAREINSMLHRINDQTLLLKQTNARLEQDIQERIRTEKALVESEERYRNILDAAPDSITITRVQDGRLVEMNHLFQETSGYAKEDVIGRTLDELNWFVDEALPRRILKMLRLRQKVDAIPAQLRLKDGQVRDTLLSARNLWYQNEACIITVVTDVTDLKRVEQEKQELQIRLQRSKKMESLGLLAGGVAHDLNNVLSGIVSYPDLLLMDLPPESPMIKPIKTIKDSGKKAAAIVQDLLTLARRGVVSAEIVNLNDIIDEYLDSPEHRQIMSYYPLLSVETQLETNLPNLKGSPVHLKKAIMNLVSNAAEAQPSGGLISISTQSVYLDRVIKGYDTIKSGEYVMLRVRDKGEGINEQDLNRIFEPFYTKKKMGRSGTGLGLAVVWGTVKDHDGYIDVSSHKGQGTFFELFFPLSRMQVLTKEKQQDLSMLRGNQEVILVVDDLATQRDIATDLLQRLNYRVFGVESGEKAVEFIRTNAVDLVILDMIMDPGLDGYETYQRLIAVNPVQKAIIASGYAETDRVKRAQLLGAGEYIKKPYLIESLGRVVKDALTRP